MFKINVKRKKKQFVSFKKIECLCADAQMFPRIFPLTVQITCQTKSIWKSRQQRSWSTETLINIAAVAIPWLLLVGKQKPTNRVNWPAKDYLDFENRERRDSLVLVESNSGKTHWQKRVNSYGTLWP